MKTLKLHFLKGSNKVKVNIEKTVTKEIEITGLDDIGAIQDAISKRKDTRLKSVIDDDGHSLPYTWNGGRKVYYTPTCPRGYDDCVCDPAYIKAKDPNWYRELYGDVPVSEAVKECIKRVEEDPNEEEYCYDDEDK